MRQRSQRSGEERLGPHRPQSICVWSSDVTLKPISRRTSAPSKRDHRLVAIAPLGVVSHRGCLSVDLRRLEKPKSSAMIS